MNININRPIEYYYAFQDIKQFQFSELNQTTHFALFTFLQSHTQQTFIYCFLFSKYSFLKTN